MYDFDTLDTQGGFYDGSNKTILWNAALVPVFSSLPPGKSGEVLFKINIKDSFPSVGVGTRNFSVKASSKLSTPNVPSGVDGNEVAVTAELATRISTKPTFSRSEEHTSELQSHV